MSDFPSIFVQAVEGTRRTPRSTLCQIDAPGRLLVRIYERFPENLRVID